MRSRRRRQVHLRHRGRPNRASYRRWRQTINWRGKNFFFRMEPLTAETIIEATRLFDQRCEEMFGALRVPADRLFAADFGFRDRLELVGASRIGDVVFVSPPLRQSEDPGYEISVLRYYDEI